MQCSEQLAAQCGQEHPKHWPIIVCAIEPILREEAPIKREICCCQKFSLLSLYLVKGTKVLWKKDFGAIFSGKEKLEAKRADITHAVRQYMVGGGGDLSIAKMNSHDNLGQNCNDIV